MRKRGNPDKEIKLKSPTIADTGVKKIPNLYR